MLAARQLLPLTFSIALTGCGNERAVESDAAPPRIGAETAGTAAVVPLTEPEAALLAAAVKGDADRVKALLDQGTKVDARDENGGTALGHAVWYGHRDVVRLLIERGADVNAKKLDGFTPLQLAAASNHAEVAEMLTKAGAR
jgi:hypothetical protein